MALILDTNALSAFVDGDERLLHATESQAELAIPTVVVGEYLSGISQSRKRAAYQAWIRTNQPFFDRYSGRSRDCRALFRDPARVKSRRHSDSDQRSLDRRAGPASPDSIGHPR